MRLALVVAGTLLLGGCSMREAAETACGKLGHIPSTYEYDACVERSVEKRQRTMRAIAAGMGGAAEAGRAQTQQMMYAPTHARFYKGEYLSGMNKICLYDTVNGTEAMTISAAQVCPIR